MTTEALEAMHRAEPLHPKICRNVMVASVVRGTGWAGICALMLVCFYVSGGAMQWYFFVPWSVLCAWTVGGHIVRFIKMSRKRTRSELFWEAHPQRAMELIVSHNQSNTAGRVELMRQSSSVMGQLMLRTLLLGVIAAGGVIVLESLHSYEHILTVGRGVFVVVMILLCISHIPLWLRWQKRQRELRRADQELLSIRRIQNHLPRQLEGALSPTHDDGAHGAISQIFE